MLGLLAIHADAVVRHETISEMLWGSEPPVTASGIVQSHVSRLRVLLDPDRPRRGRGGLLEAAGSGYRLQADYAEVDLVRYRQLAAVGRSTRQAGDAAGACALYEQAANVWLGLPVADVDLLSAHPAVTRLVQQHAELVVEYAETAAGLGWHDRVLTHLHGLVEQDPLNERAHASLMIALAGSGHQVAALELFEQLRWRLNDQLGVRPGHSLCSAHARVLRNEIPPSAPDPAGMDSVAIAADGHPIRVGVPVPPFQLPPGVTDFAGRKDEVVKLQEILGPDEGRPGVPIVVIGGPPGVGKTSLTIHVGHLMRAVFPDGQLWAQLDGASERPRDPGEVLGEFLRALGVPGSAIPESTHERAALYRSRLADYRVMVVADDAASAAQVLPLMPGTSGCAVMVTSRRQLAELPGAQMVVLAPLSAGEAMELLGSIAGRDRVAAEAEAASELAAGCGQLPLAVRIAGAKLAARPSVPIAVLVRGVADERSRLDALQIGDMSVRASIESGYQALSDPARRAFRLVSLLGPGDIADWVIAALLGQGEATEVVNELCDRSMLTLCGTGPDGQARFRLHDLLRSFACEQLAQEPEAGQAAALHRAHDGWLQLASLASTKLSANPFMPPVGETSNAEVVPADRATRITADPLAWFAAERLNLLAAVAAACAGGRYAFAAELAKALAAYEHIQDRHDDAEANWRKIAEAAARSGDRLAEVHARVRFGAALLERSYAAAALDVLDPCIPVLDQIGDTNALALGLYWRGMSAWDLGAYEQARSDAERGITLAQQAGNRQAECMNLRSLGQALAMLGQRDAAIDAGERGVAIAAELAGVSYLKVARHNLATTCVWVGDYHRAVDLCQHNLGLCQRAGDARMTALSLGVLGDALSGLGRYQEAIDMLSSALPVFREHAHERFEALCLLKRGCAYQALNHQAEAIGDLERSLPIFRRLSLLHYAERTQRVLDECLAAAAAAAGR